MIPCPDFKQTAYNAIEALYMLTKSPDVDPEQTWDEYCSYLDIANLCTALYVTSLLDPPHGEFKTKEELKNWIVGNCDRTHEQCEDMLFGLLGLSD